jgi:uncharacterized membrane protein
MDKATAHLPELENVLSNWIHIVGNGIEVFGVFVIVAGIAWSTFLFIRGNMSEAYYETYKIRIGRSLLLGLEVLVAADIVKTIALDVHESQPPDRIGARSHFPELDARSRNRRPMALAT